MSLLVALDQSEVAAEVLVAIEPYLRSTATETHLATIVEEGEIRHAGSGGSAAAPERAGADLSGGRLPVGTPAAGTSVTRSQAIQQVVDEHRAELQRLATEHLHGLPVRVHVEVADDVPEGIVALADELRVDSIAIGTHGRGGLRRALLGSVAEEVIRKSHVPVFVVREGMRKPDEGEADDA
jgi:nucleotide-binding universal stress UspA family protein